MARKRLLLLSIGLLTLAVAVLSVSALAQSKSAGIPKDYRSWMHVKSMVLQQSHPLFEAFGGIHHVYVNRKGAPAAQKGGPYPEGTIFVFDLFEADSSGGALTEGKRKVIATMTKDKKFAETGGWRWEAYAGGDPQKQIVKNAANECWACHQPQEKTDYVFSAWRQ